MDKILYCKTCLAKSKNQLMNARAYAESFMYPEKYRGIVFEKEDNKICPNCQAKMIDTGLDGIKEFDRITEFGNYSVDFLLAMINLKKNDIIKYTNQMNIINAKAEDESQKRYNEYIAQQNQVRCPRCGSTQITTGQTFKRALFGLMYNQVAVNRCANCGCTWEPRG